MRRAQNKNFRVLLLDAVLYAVALTFLDTNTVIPSFLDALGASPISIGLAASLKQLGFLLPQFYVLVKIPLLKNQAGFMRTVMLIGRPQLLIFLIILLLFPKQPFLPVLFLISLAIFYFGEGVIQLPWMNLLGCTVRANLRGKLWGMAQVAGGLGSLAGGYLIAKLLNMPEISFPEKYFYIFSCGLLLLMPALYYFRWLENPAPWPDARPVSLPGALRAAWQDNDFRRMLAVQFLTSSNMLTLPYYIITVKHRFPFLAAQTGTFVCLSITGGILGGFLWGYLSDRKGNRLAIICTVMSGIVMAGCFWAALFINDSALLSLILKPAFLLVGMSGGGWLSFVNYMMELGDDHSRLHFITLNNACRLPLVLLPVLGGLLRVSYSDRIIFAAVAIFSILALFPALKLTEPRKFHSWM